FHVTGVQTCALPIFGVGAAADHGDARRTVDRLAFGVFRHEGLVARLLDVLGDAGDSVVPADLVPVVGAGAADLGGHQPVRVGDVVTQRGALGTQGAAVDGGVGIAFDVDHRRLHVLGLVAEGV